MTVRLLRPRERAKLLLDEAIRRQKINTQAALEQTLTLSRDAVAIAPAGSLALIRAHAFVAASAVDLGGWSETIAAAEHYLALLPAHPEAAELAPWVLLSAGLAYVRTGKVQEGLDRLHQARRLADGPETWLSA